MEWLDGRQINCGARSRLFRGSKKIIRRLIDLIVTNDLFGNADAVICEKAHDVFVLNGLDWLLAGFLSFLLGGRVKAACSDENTLLTLVTHPLGRQSSCFSCFCSLRLISVRSETYIETGGVCESVWSRPSLIAVLAISVYFRRLPAFSKTFSAESV